MKKVILFFLLLSNLTFSYWSSKAIKDEGGRSFSSNVKVSNLSSGKIAYVSRSNRGEYISIVLNRKIGNKGTLGKVRFYVDGGVSRLLTGIVGSDTKTMFFYKEGNSNFTALINSMKKGKELKVTIESPIYYTSKTDLSGI